MRRRVDAFIPPDSRNVGVSRYLPHFEACLRSLDRRPRILVVGGGIVGAGLEDFLNEPDLDLVETDVYIGPRTRVVCDGQDLPFRDGTFDGAICQAVLQAIPDPQRVVSEIHRVLAPDGLVYSDAPFMQQVCGGALDFTRYSLTGHRRLYRCFDEVAGGISCGAGMSLAWAIRYFMIAVFARSQRSRALVARATRFFTWWLPLIDTYLLDAPGALDAASGTIFVGRRRATPLTDNEITRRYGGLCPTRTGDAS